MSGQIVTSRAARSLSPRRVLELSDGEVLTTFRQIRWPDTGGRPCCPKCAFDVVYEYRTRQLWKCKACEHQFSMTSGTIFSGHKLDLRTILFVISEFVTAPKGLSARQLAEKADISYRTAFVLLHKLREAMVSLVPEGQLTGPVEIDGCFVGGYVKPRNKKESREDRRKRMSNTGKRKTIAAIRQREGRILTLVTRLESHAVEAMRDRIVPGEKVYADQARCWKTLAATHDLETVCHKTEFALEGGINTNLVESFFSRVKRAEIGSYHHIAGRYLPEYAVEIAWREDHRLLTVDGRVRLLLGAAVHHPVSRRWKDYGRKRKEPPDTGFRRAA